MLLEFAKRLAGSWFQRPDGRRWTLYSNDHVTTEEIDHVLVDGRWKMVMNCRVVRSAQFFTTDHRLLVTTLRQNFRRPRKAASGLVRVDFGQLERLDVTRGYAERLGQSLGEPVTNGDPETMWSDFRTNVPTVAGECIRRPRKSDFAVTRETVSVHRQGRIQDSPIEGAQLYVCPRSGLCPPPPLQEFWLLEWA